MTSRERREAFRFFHEHAGYIVGRRAEGALALARAESLLHEAEAEQVAEIVWEYDDVPYDVDGYTDEEIAEKFETNEWTGPFYCLLRVAGETVASLGGIVVGPRETNDPYCRVIAAELADEAEDDLRQAVGDARDARQAVCNG